MIDFDLVSETISKFQSIDCQLEMLEKKRDDDLGRLYAIYGEAIDYVGPSVIEEEDIDPYAEKCSELYFCLLDFLEKKTYARARYLLLFYLELNLLPAQEVMEAIVSQYKSDIEGWEWKRVSTARYLHPAVNLCEVFDKFESGVRSDLQCNGFKGNKGDVCDEMARLYNEKYGENGVSGDSLRKRVERSRQGEEGPMGEYGETFGTRLFGALTDYFKSSLIPIPRMFPRV